ncbi:MAG: zinc-binding dehydrogenase [Cellulomonas sp.]|nr:zinc-binding dehydrogenase [Cellulomonas sp.]
MLTAYAAGLSSDNPLGGLVVGELPAPQAEPGWTVVDVRAATLNHHDLWSLRGVGLGTDRLPMVLGTDAAGVTADGREVVVHAVIGGLPGTDLPRSILSERYPGTLAQQVAVPTVNLVDKPAGMGFAQASCVPTAYLTAYRMLFRSGRATPGQRVLIQGAGGGVSSAAVVLAAHAGLEVVVTSRSAAKRERALQLGAAQAVEPGTRIGRVDLVIETVGAATWSHSVRSVRPGGTIVVAGATTGDPSAMEISRIFFTEITVVGATMGTRDELGLVLTFLDRAGIEPVIDRRFPLTRAHEAFAALAAGDGFGKIVVEP